MSKNVLLLFSKGVLFYDNKKSLNENTDGDF